jgi:lysyl-tRNA synthetase class 2
MTSLLRTARVAAAVVGGFAVVFAASGWLYLVDAGRIRLGPRIADALPLDELPRHASAPLLLFLGVWIAGAVVLAAIARRMNADRVTAALLLALAVGTWSYLQTAVSILVVRQIAAEDAFRAAAEVHAVYIPPALAGLAGALLCSAPPVRHRAALLLAAFVAAAGLLAVVDALLPDYGHTLIGSFAPGERSLARSLEGPLGLALLAVAPRLARRRTRAWQLAVGFLAGSTLLHALHSDYAAVPVALLALVLVSYRHVFDAPGDPEGKPRILVRALLLLTVVYVYGFAALWVNRVAADQPFGVSFALRETSRALVGLSLRGSPALTGSFDEWFGPSVLALGLASAAWVVQAWLAPWGYRCREEARARLLTRSLVRAWGVDTLAPFALRADKSYFFSANEQALLAYRVVAGVAIVSGDAIGPAHEIPQLLREFLRFARARDWRVAVLGASEKSLPLYRSQGLRALYHGDEAVIDVACFSLEGRAIRKVRQSAHRLGRAGYGVRVLRAGELSAGLKAELAEIARAWRGREPQRGFAMALDDLFRLEDDDALFVIGVDPDGRARGFLHLAVCPAAMTLSLSSMPRFRDTPNGFTEWLVSETIEWSRAHGFRRVSLNFAPFAALLAPEARLSPPQRLQRRVLLAMKGHFQLDNLLLFNRKFFPSWQRRFVVYQRFSDLPRIVIAALAAEAYLPFAGRAAR